MFCIYFKDIFALEQHKIFYLSAT